jgi:phosphatidylserine decarboxylase
MSIGHSPDVEPHRPDMKKAESEVTAQEKEEARRRIEGAGAAGEGVPEGTMPPSSLGAPVAANVS